jgi:hypothetical protein
MDARFSYYDNPAAAKFTKYILSAGKVVSDSALPAATRQLVEIRASPPATTSPASSGKQQATAGLLAALLA